MLSHPDIDIDVATSQHRSLSHLPEANVDSTRHRKCSESLQHRNIENREHFFKMASDDKMPSVSKSSRFSAKSQVIIDAQDKEIARMKKLLAQAGIDPDQVLVSASRAVQAQVIVAQVQVQVQYARHARYKLYVQAAKAAKVARVVEVVEAVVIVIGVAKVAKVVAKVAKVTKDAKVPIKVTAKVATKVITKVAKVAKVTKEVKGAKVALKVTVKVAAKVIALTPTQVVQKVSSVRFRLKYKYKYKFKIRFKCKKK